MACLTRDRTDMRDFTWFDITLALIILWSALTGLRSGLARVVVGFVAAIVGLLAGFWFYRIVAERLLPYVKTPTLADIFGFLIVFVGVLIIGSVIGSLFSRFFRWAGLSWFNHALGAVAGFFRGALIIAALTDVFVAFAPSPLPDSLARSRVLPYVGEISGWLADLAPRSLKDAFDEQMQNLKRQWTAPPGQPHSQTA